MGKTCKIYSDDVVFNALDSLMHQHVAAVIRTRYEIAKKDERVTKLSEYLIEQYNKHKDRPFENRVFNNYEDARNYFLDVRADYDLVNPPRQIPGTDNYQVYSYSSRQFGTIYTNLLDIFDTLKSNEQIKFEKEIKDRQREANEAFNDEGELYSPANDIDYSVLNYLIIS